MKPTVSDIASSDHTMKEELDMSTRWQSNIEKVVAEVKCRKAKGYPPQLFRDALYRWLQLDIRGKTTGRHITISRNVGTVCGAMYRELMRQGRKLEAGLVAEGYIADQGYPWDK
jgi:hypothetical protein